MPHIQLADARLHYEIDDYTDPWRTPSTVLMIHGFTESTPAWLRWVPGLARDFRVIRYDQLGFGQSAPVENEHAFSTQRFVDHAAQLIERLGHGRAHVIGAKSGGLVAIELARLRPDCVASITLASVPLDPPQPSNWLAHMEQHGVKSWARDTMPPRLGSSVAPEAFEWWVNLMGATRIETARAYMHWVSNIDVGATLDQVKCPVLILKTEAPRRAYSRGDASVYEKKLPQAVIVVFNQVDGYHLGATHPDDCAMFTRDFLKGIEKETEPPLSAS